MPATHPGGNGGPRPDEPPDPVGKWEIKLITSFKERIEFVQIQQRLVADPQHMHTQDSDESSKKSSPFKTCKAL